MKEFSLPKKGMIKDLDDLNLAPESYIHALNALMENSSGDGFLLQNDYSNILGAAFIENENIISKLYISELNKIILFTTANRIIELSGVEKFNDSDFNVYDAQEGSAPISPSNNITVLTSKILASSDCFNWNIEHKVKITYKITDSTLNLYFVDGFNEDRYIYFNLKDNELTIEETFKTILAYDNYNTPIYGNTIDCNTLKWYPELSYPTITTTDTEGGSLLAGVYQFMVAFATSKGVALTNYKAAINPHHLKTKTITDVTNYDTGRAIIVKVGGLNTVGRYRYFNIVAVETINEVTSYKLVGTFPVDTETEYTYTGDNKAIILDESSIFQIYPFYRSSNGLTKANNKLFKFGVKEFSKYNLQPIMHKIALKWFTITAQEGDYAKPNFAQNFRSHLRDEVYTYGIVFILDNGEETPVFLLIGRPKNATDKIRIPNANKDNFVKNQECVPETPVEHWQIYNTATVTKTSTAELGKCDYKQYQEGDFAYTESTDLYPNDVNVWGEVAGTPIRHFKMPDCLVSPHQNTSTSNVKNFIYPLGVKIDEAVNMNDILQDAVNEGLITQEQKNRIRGYKLVRGNRVNNKSIVAKGLLYNTYQYTENARQVVYPNYPFNDLRLDPYLSGRKLINDPLEAYAAPDSRNEFNANNKYTFHSADTHFRQPSVGTILKVEQENYGTANGFFNKSKGQGEYVVLGQDHYNFAILIAWLMTERLELSKAQPGEQGSAIGSGIGAIAGGVIGAFAGGIGAPLGAALGSGLGGIIGRLIGGHTADDDYNGTYRLSMWLSQTDRILELLQNTTPLQNYHYQYQAVGNYHGVTPVPNAGTKQREIKASSYLNGTRQELPNGVFFNNNNRESSLYLELGEDLPKPTNIDNSRFTMSTYSEDGCDMNEGEDLASKISSYYASIKRNILNQYSTVNSIDWIPMSNKVWKTDEKAQEFGGDTYINRFALKRKHSFFSQTSFHLPDRTDIYYEDYPNIAYPRYFFNTKYTELNEPQSFTLKSLEGITNATNVVLALSAINNPKAITENLDTAPHQTSGTMEAIARVFRQTLMNPYTVTRPGRFNLDCRSGQFYTQLPATKPSDGVEIEYETKGDRFWNLTKYIGWGGAATFFDNSGSRFFYNFRFEFSGIKGKIYTYNYGIPYFIGESDINVDLRHAEDPNEKNFYPNQKDLEYWLQEENVSPKIDNYYSYNRTYSKQNKEQIILKNDVNFFRNKDKISYPNRVIYSQDGAEVENFDFKDNYLYFKPLDSFDFTYENGKLIAVDGIENEQVLVRFENNTRIFNAFNTIKTDGLDLALGSGGLFGLRPQEFSKTSLGYVGSQHSDMLHTPYGHIVVDAKRGNVFNIASGGKGIDELTKDGMRNWFAENLPFKISEYFTNVDIDNNFNKFGIALSYDNRYKRFFITKLDYLPLVKGITYENNEFWYNGLQIQVTDSLYFCNKSWTVSYSFYTKSWCSFHSFTPNYYVDGVSQFYTGLNGNGRGKSSLWIHNLTNKSFQIFYKNLYPFEVEAFTKPKINYDILNSVSFVLDVVRYHNEYDEAHILNKASFNKAIVWNKHQNSGLLELDAASSISLFKRMSYPLKQLDRTNVLLSNKENLYSFNQFKNIAHLNLPKFINSCNNVNKILNLKALNYQNFKINNDVIRGDKNFVKLINDKYSEYKFIFKGIVSDETPSVR